jgi:hypothetical protein
MVTEYMDSIIGSGVNLKEFHLQRVKISSNDLRRLSQLKGLQSLTLRITTKEQVSILQ